MDHRRSDRFIKHTRVSDLLQELQERNWRAGNSKIRPLKSRHRKLIVTQSSEYKLSHANLGVMELNDLARFGRLEVSDAEQALREVLVVLSGQEFNR